MLNYVSKRQKNATTTIAIKNKRDDHLPHYLLVQARLLSSQLIVLHLQPLAVAPLTLQFTLDVIEFSLNSNGRRKKQKKINQLQLSTRRIILLLRTQATTSPSFFVLTVD